MYSGADGYNFDFDKELRGDMVRVTPVHAQKASVDHPNYPGHEDGYAYDYDRAAAFGNGEFAHPDISVKKLESKDVAKKEAAPAPAAAAAPAPVPLQIPLTALT